VDFVSFLSNTDLGAGAGQTGANLWGWTDPLTGKEYVLMALTDSTAFVDISDPENPVVIGTLPTQTIPSNAYRDVKVYQDHAFIIADQNSLHGMQVFDLTQLRDVITPTVTFTATTHYDGFGDSHNIFINEETGYAYVARTTTPLLCSGALYIVDVNDPLNPTEAGCFDQGGLASDSICVIYQGPDPDYQGKEVCVVSSDDNILVADVTDKSNTAQIGLPMTYSNIVRAHHGWLTPDHRYFLSSDMDDEHHLGLFTRIFIWDFLDVDNPILIGVYNGPSTASDHNVWINGWHAYVGNFRAGLRILDLFGISNGDLVQSAYFDMVPSDDFEGHDAGAWAAYVYFDSGIVAVSEKPAGLYLLRPHLAEPALWLPIVKTADP
jgi:choice-of-anchor B domain-containing protein